MSDQLMIGLESQDNYKPTSSLGFDDNSQIKTWAEDLNDELKKKADDAIKKVKKLEISNDIIKLDNCILPGCVNTIDIDGELMFDEAEIPGQSGKVKQIKGFSDAVIRVNMRLFNQYQDNEYNAVDRDDVANKMYSNQSYGDRNISVSKYDMLESIDKAFKYVKDGKPVAYSIVNKHLKARGIKTIYFNKLSSSESLEGINCSLEFTETDPFVNKKQKQEEQKKAVPEKKKEENFTKVYVKEKESISKKLTDDFIRKNPVKR